MLIIHRRPGQSVILTDRATGKVVATILQLDPRQGSPHRFGIEADQSIRIDRGEQAQPLPAAPPGSEP